jgi:hypothetical protein
LSIHWFVVISFKVWSFFIRALIMNIHNRIFKTHKIVKSLESS